MSAYFFDTSEDDSFLEVAKLIGELLDGGEVRAWSMDAGALIHCAYAHT